MTRNRDDAGLGRMLEDVVFAAPFIDPAFCLETLDNATTIGFRHKDPSDMRTFIRLPAVLSNFIKWDWTNALEKARLDRGGKE